MIGKILGWASSAASPYMWIAAGIVTAVLLSVVAGGYLYVNNLQKNLIEARVALNAEQTKVSILSGTITKLKQAAIDDQKRMDELLADNASDNAGWRDLLGKINELDACPETIEGKTDVPDPSDAPNDIDVLNDQLRRMLNDATGYTSPGND
jgi:hypothetical protein